MTASSQAEADQLEGVASPEQNTAPIVGHAAAQRHLDAILESGRLPGAILLHGPQGIGKATLAFAIARRILAQTGDEDPHRVNEQISAGAHPNLYQLRRQAKDAKSFYTVIRVDEVRELRERMRRTRGRAGYRVAIVDAIDDCNPNAANALLKTLEEPPPETLFLMVAHRLGALLPTIRSRAIGVALRPLAAGEVEQVLAAQRPDAGSQAISHAASLSGGRPRRGFEALALGAEGALTSLREWLAVPGAGPVDAPMDLADALVAEAGGAEMSFARDLIDAWLAGEAEAAAIAGPAARTRLASANELWEKAHALFADADSLNLDTRQTLVAVFDAIRNHVERTSPLSEPR